MKKMIGTMVALTLALSLCACGGQPAAEQEAQSGAAAETETKEAAEAASGSADANSGEVTQEQIEANIIGKWIKSEVDGQPVLTNEKSVYDIVSVTEAYASVSRVTDEGTPFDYNQKSTVDINGNVVTIATTSSDGTSLVHEFTITKISDSEFTANQNYSHTREGADTSIREDTVSFIKVNDDFSKDIIGTWEGHCTSEGYTFDDGQYHRWEYKDDGTYVYYVKDGENWIPSADTLDEYFVDGNLLCSRWVEYGEENREWWDISIDGDKMNWTALREDEDGKAFTATFEMTKVEE